jgi:hypothetical protein
MTISHQLMTVANQSQYWIAVFDGIDNLTGVDVDSRGNIAIAGFNRASVGDGPIVAKLKKTGVIVWQKKLATYPLLGKFNDIAVDSSGNLIACGNVGNSNMLIAKFSPSGSLTWQKRFRDSSLGSVSAASIDTDSSDNVIFCGHDVFKFFVSKMASDGTVVWERVYAFEQGFGATIDATDSIFVAGNDRVSSVDRFIFGEIDTSAGAPVYFREHDGSSNGVSYDIAPAPDGTVVTVGYVSAFRGIVLKSSSVGGKIWEKHLNGVDPFYSVDVDESGNIYAVGMAPSLNDDLIIAKFDNDGNLLWQRQFSAPGYLSKVKVVKSAILVTLHAITGSPIVMRLPTDGSGTGTYGAYSYTEPALTVINRIDPISTRSGAAVGENIILDPFDYTPEDTAYTSELYRVKR